VLSAGVELRRSGRRLVGCCPFHEDRDPSLVVYVQTESYFCFGCDAGGDVIDFVGRLRGSAFKETAASLMATGAPRVLPANVVRFPSGRRLQGIGDEGAAVVEAAASFYRVQCERSRRVRSYLRDRGVDDHTASRLRLGSAEGGLARHLRDRGLSVDAAQQLGLLAGEHDTLEGRVVIPDLDADGRATWLTGRSLDGEGPRYLNLRVPSPLLGLTQARAVQAQAVVVTEGPFDWVTACNWGMHSVALLGTHVSHDALGALRSFRRVYLALDADGAGRRATAHLASELGARAVVVPLPEGVHDLNELGCRRGGREAFLHSLYKARARMEESWPRSTDSNRSARAA
jgi:DNA primase